MGDNQEEEGEEHLESQLGHVSHKPVPPSFFLRLQGKHQVLSLGRGAGAALLPPRPRPRRVLGPEAGMALYRPR